MDHRSPLESIFSVISHDKPVKHALYNAVALFLMFLCCAAGYAVYMILEPFIKPLIWAVLVGSALHPLKQSLRYRFQMWLETLEITKTPVILGIVFLPVSTVDSISEFIGENILKRLKLLIAFGVIVPLIHILYHYTPKIIVSIMWQLLVSVWSFLNVFLENASFWTVSIVVLGYSAAILLLWKPENNHKFHYTSLFIWLMCLCCLSQQFGSFQVPVFIILQIVIFGGFISEVYTIYEMMNNSGYPITINESLSLAFHNDHQRIQNYFAENASQDYLNNKLTVETVKKIDFDEVAKKKEDLDMDKYTEHNASAKKKTDREKHRNYLDFPSVQDALRNDPWSLDLFKNEINNRNPETSSPDGDKLKREPSDAKIGKTNYANIKKYFFQPQLASDEVDKESVLKLGKKLSVSFSSGSLVDATSYESTFYLFAVLWACIIMFLWKNVMLLPLLPIPIFFYITKHIGLYIGLWKYIDDNYHSILKVISNWCENRHDVLVPVPMRGLYHVVHTINLVVKTAINKSMDTVATFVVIFGLIIFVVCASIFIAFQIYAEAIMLAQMTVNVINQTVVHNPELRHLLPPAWDDTVDSILDNAYQYGREGLSKVMKSVVPDSDSTKSENLEKRVLELWDRIYQNWMSTNDCNGPKVTEDAIQKSWEKFLEGIQKYPEIFHLDGAMEFGKQHIGTLKALLESVWSIFKGNVTLIVSSFGTFLSVILGGGSAVLNFLLNMVVFLTTLFYLLNSSGDLYKPVEMLTNFSSSGRSLGLALEAAINGVFFASFKMAAFYGMWTWFIHNLFGVKIVYLPTAFATILGSVPFLGTYWACIPAVLDLWLVEKRGVAAILFAIFQFLPTSIVDTIIYREIKGGGHPYLTGLAIAGGIFCLGVEGAIMGPMILCGLYVAVNLSSSLFKESSQESFEPRNN